MDGILFDRDGQLAIITLNRPETYNSFNKAMALRLQDVLDRCAEDDDIRAILLTGAGKAFCAGQDLKEVTSPDGPPLADIVAKHYNPIIHKIRRLPKPVVAAVNGVAAGAGANIALACDIVVAARSARFIQAFSKIGLIPDSGGTYFLPRLVGFQRASALMMLGDPVGADEAVQMGMIYRAIEDEHFEEETLRLGRKLAAMPTKGLAMTKQALNRAYVNDLAAQLALEAELQPRAGETEDYKEGVAAFLEKRKPEFKGR